MLKAADNYSSNQLVRIAKRLNIYVGNDLYDDSGFEQTYQTFLDIGVQQGCTGKGPTTQGAATPAPARVAKHIKAGGYVCDSAFQVMGERQLRGNAPVAFRGCAQIGADTEVNILGRDSNYDAIKVGVSFPYSCPHFSLNMSRRPAARSTLASLV